TRRRQPALPEASAQVSATCPAFHYQGMPHSCRACVPLEGGRSRSEERVNGSAPISRDACPLPSLRLAPRVIRGEPAGLSSRRDHVNLTRPSEEGNGAEQSRSGMGSHAPRVTPCSG